MELCIVLDTILFVSTWCEKGVEIEGKKSANNVTTCVKQ